MPPKAKKNEPSKKTEMKKKEKVIEDKTFGLKNKKGAKTQKFIQQVEKQVKQGNVKASKMEELSKAEREKKKLDKKKEQDELNSLFRPVQQLSKGADPKSVVCAFFKQGQCTKGDKCKFSHDLNLSRKGEKRNAYEAGAEEMDTMENWDEAKLEEVVHKKHGESEKSKPKTAIICKYFLEAVENSKYGWFWECPSGKGCIYRHALPPDFVLKKDMKKDEKEDQISIEELIETQRAALGYNTTKVTLQTFLEWKARKKREKELARSADTEKKKAEFKAGKTTGISGRQMFEFKPELMIEDDQEAEEAALTYEREKDEDGDEGVEVSTNQFGMTEADGSGTQRIAPLPTDPTAAAAAVDDEAGKLAEASALPPCPQAEAEAAIAAAMAATVNGSQDMAIDEDLFACDDIDEIDDELETLELDD